MQAQQADKPHAGRSARKQAAPLRVPLEHRPGKAAEAAPTGQRGAGQRGGASAPDWPGGPLLCLGRSRPGATQSKQQFACTYLGGKTVNTITIALNQAQNFKYKSQQEVVNTFIMG